MSETWKRSYECISTGSGAIYCGTDDDPIEKAMANGVVYRSDGTNDQGDEVFLILCTSPDFAHFEETGWLHVWSWRGTARDLVCAGIEIEGSVGRFTGYDPHGVLKVFDKRRYAKYPTTDCWTLNGKTVLRNGRPASDELVIKKLGWILRRMSLRHKHERGMVPKSEGMEEYLGRIEG